MLAKTDQGFYILSSFNKFKDLAHGFSTKSFGDMMVNVPGNEERRRRFAKALGISNAFVTAEQAHKNKIVRVGSKEIGKTLSGAGGLVTTENGVNLIIRVADCLPILAFDPTKKMVGIAHAGWRGTMLKVTENLIKTFEKLGSDPRNIMVGFGPGIEFCHYEIKEDVAEKFYAAGLGKFVLRSVSGKLFLDLKQANLAQVERARVPRENIDLTIKSCTYENPDFYSSRRGNSTERIAAVVGLKE